jgi:hypothetical protein
MAIEKLLICYDWAEAFVALNLVLKPLIDELFMNHLSDLALREGDYLLGRILYSLGEDCRWHREWSQALTRMVIEDNSHNIGVIQGWMEKWHPVAARAAQAFAPLFEGTSEDAQMSQLEGVVQKLDKFHRGYLSALGLQPTIPGILLSRNGVRRSSIFWRITRKSEVMSPGLADRSRYTRLWLLTDRLPNGATRKLSRNRLLGN